MNITVRTDEKEITVGILNATRSSINDSLHRAAINIRRDIQKMMDGLLRRSPEYISLTTGILRGDFGLDDPEVRLDEVLKTLREAVDVSVVPVSTFGKELRGGLNIGMLRTGFTDILNLPGATNKTQDIEIPWLRWLLLSGDRILVAGYHITYNISPAERRNSMSGIAIMRKGGGWRVPPEFSGSETDNWLTRTFNVRVIESIINKVVETNIKRNLR